MPKDAPPNGGAREVVPEGSWSRVSGMQAKLHRWAAADPGRRFDDLFNLVHDPATLIVAFDRVAGNRGASTPGVDGMTVALVEERIGVPGFLDDLRASLKTGTFRPLPVRETAGPGAGAARPSGRVPTAYLRRRGTACTIPEKAGQVRSREHQGGVGSRPPRSTRTCTSSVTQWAANRVASPRRPRGDAAVSYSPGTAVSAAVARGEPLNAHAVFAGRGRDYRSRTPTRAWPSRSPTAQPSMPPASPAWPRCRSPGR